MEEIEVFSNQELEILENIKNSGINPYPVKFYIKQQAKEVKEDFATWEGKTVTMAGRVITKREHGKAGFATILSNGTPMQIYFRKDTLGDEKFSIIKKTVTVGDIIGVTGTIFKTHTEEITIDLQEITLLSKALSPLPEKWHGIENIEVRYRQRYLDLIINPGIREIFETRSKMIATIRKTLAGQGYMEVETPTLQEIYGGALAKPFTTHHNALDQDLFLRIAPELYLKRLIIGGFEKVFEIGKMFRNEGISVNHNPEFTMMELYQAYGNFETMMDICEVILKALCDEVIKTNTIEFKGQTIHMNFPFRRITLKEAFLEYGNVSITDLKDMEFAKTYLKQEGIRIDKPLSWSSVVDEVLKKKGRAQLD